MFAHLLALIVGKAFAHRFCNTIEHSAESLQSHSRLGVIHPRQYDQAAGEFDRISHRRTVEGYLDEIAFPVLGNQSVFYFGWAHMETGHVLNLTSPVFTPRQKERHTALN